MRQDQQDFTGWLQQRLRLHRIILSIMFILSPKTEIHERTRQNAMMDHSIANFSQECNHEGHTTTSNQAFSQFEINCNVKREGKQVENSEL